MTEYQGLFKNATKMAKSFSKLAVKTSRAVAEGDKIISPAELAHRRIAICEKCPSLNKDLGRCMECGCFVKAKTRVNFEECPLGKW